MLNAILDLFFPKRCAGCRQEGSYFCASCRQEISHKDLICPICKRSSSGGVTHDHCSQQYGLDGLWSFGAFRGGLRTALQKLKYKFITEQAEVLTDLAITEIARSRPVFLEQIAEDRGQCWVITSVPLHWKRQNWRGFNQSELLAKKLAQKMGIPYLQLLKRGTNTTSQTHFNAEERQRNMKNVFSLNISISKYLNILIIDDVWTTGSTISECCFTLKKNGAKKIWALTMAR